MFPEYIFILVICIGHGAAQADPERLGTMLRSHFSSVRHHITGPDDKIKARNFIESEMRQYGLTVDNHQFNTEVENVTGVNVIGILKGVNFGKETDVLSGIAAHYDTVSQSPGVDDNGAGVVAMLQAAKSLAQKPRDNTVLFFAFDFEESQTEDSSCRDGLCGSDQMLDDWLPGFLVETYGEGAMRKGLPRFMGTVVMDTIMNFDQKNETQEEPAGLEQIFSTVVQSIRSDGRKGDFIAVIGRQDESTMSELFSIAWHHSGEQKYEIELLMLPICDTITREQAMTFGDFFRSDHASFWKRNYNAVFLTDTANFRGYMRRCYHAACDNVTVLTREKLNFLGKISDSLVYLFEMISPATQTVTNNAGDRTGLLPLCSFRLALFLYAWWLLF